MGYPMRVRLEPDLSLKKGAGALKRFWKRFILPWTCRRAVERARRAFRPKLPSAAYIIVYDDDHARLALLLLKAFGISRYIVHFMDLFHDAGTRGLDGGHLDTLVRGASVVRVINRRLRDEVARWRTDHVEQAQLLGISDSVSSDVTHRSPILLMTGMLYSEDESRVRFLREVFAPAWRRFKAGFPGAARWVYCGRSYHMLPADLAREIENLGFLEDEEFNRLLKNAKCGIMPIEHSPHDRWRFSLPSRLVDFLAAGLPFMAPPNAGTATGDFLAANRGFGVRILLDEQDTLSALNKMFNDPEWYAAQCRAALTVAGEFDLDAGAARFNDMVAGLAEKSGPRTAVPAAI
jgi:hypothetical protein